jgi:hypothetical protein
MPDGTEGQGQRATAAKEENKENNDENSHLIGTLFLGALLHTEFFSIGIGDLAFLECRP